MDSVPPNGRFGNRCSNKSVEDHPYRHAGRPESSEDFGGSMISLEVVLHAWVVLVTVSPPSRRLIHPR